jgi:uncharacterized protein (DUF433 family)
MTLSIETKPVPLTVSKDGIVFVAGTRVPIDTVVYAFREGATAEQIAEDYSAIKLADVYAVISYYLNHRDEVDAHLLRQESDREAVRRANEARFPSKDIRERLLARLQNRSQL